MSCIKVRGMELSIPLDRLTFSYSSEATVVLGTDLDEAPQRWTFWQLQPSPDYLLSPCPEQRAANALRLVLQPALPHITGPLSATSVEL